MAAVAFALGILTVAAIALLLLSGEDPAATTIADPPGIGPSTTLDPLSRLPTTVVEVSGSPWDVAVAAEPHEWIQGLRGVSDLGALQGMLFVSDEDTATPFVMEDTLIPLDIAFFAADGTLVDILAMEPCTVTPCPRYTASGPYRYALEAPTGAFAAIDQPLLDPNP